MVFDAAWFVQHQSVLLRWVNSPIVGRVMRQRLGLTHMPYPLRIVRLAPQDCHAALTRTQRVAMFYSRPVLAKRMAQAFWPVWAMCHEWDRRVANPLLTPAWNLGFDTLDAYPNADPETTTVDGYVYRGVSGEDFNTIRAGTGTVANDTAGFASTWASVQSGSTKGLYIALYRGFLLFDTSSLSTAQSIDAASLYHYVTGVLTSLGDNGVSVVTSNPSSNTALATGDFTTVGSTAYSTISSLAGLATNAYNAMNFSETTPVNGSGITKLGIRLTGDISGTAPGTGKSSFTSMQCNFADYTSNDPYLRVTYTPGGGGGTTHPGWDGAGRW
jgi:hypothetical protein